MGYPAAVSQWILLRRPVRSRSMDRDHDSVPERYSALSVAGADPVKFAHYDFLFRCRTDSA
ncbi:hypothetical protein ACFL46_00710 [Candidatus Neomarinimicrobiota bacterium]